VTANSEYRKSIPRFEGKVYIASCCQRAVARQAAPVWLVIM